MADKKPLALSSADVEIDQSPSTGQPLALTSADVDTQNSASSPASSGPSAGTKTRRFLEDVSFPGLGATVGGIVGAPLGPLGIAGLAGIGAMGGEALKQNIRRITDPDAAPGSPEEAMKDITIQGMFGPMQEAGAAMRAGSKASQALETANKLGVPSFMATPQQRLGAEFGVPMSRAQQTQGTLSTAFESLIRRSFGAAGIFRKNLDQPANEALGRAGEKIADELSGLKGSPQEVGVFVKGAIDAADRGASSVYNEALQKISDAGARNTRLNVTGPLQRTAQELVSQLKINPDFEQGLASAEGRAKALNILEQFANPYKEGTSVMANGTTIRGNQLVKNLTWEEARRLRTQLFELANSGEINIGKGALKKLNSALNDAMKQGLIDNGRADLAKSFEKASSNFKAVQDKIEQSTIQRLVNNDKPELVADILLQKGAESSAQNLRSLIGAKNMTRVERALWENILSKTTQSNEGVMVGGSLERTFNELGPETQQAIWGNRPELLSKIRRFVKLADTVALNKNLTTPLSSQGTSLLAFGQFAAGTALVGKALKGDADSSDLLKVGAVFLAPQMVARLMTNPAAIDVMNKAMSSKPGSRIAREMTTRLILLLQSQSLKDKFDARGKEMIKSSTPLVTPVERRPFDYR